MLPTRRPRPGRRTWPTTTYLDSPALRRSRTATDGPLLALAIGSLPLLALKLERSQLPTWGRPFLDIVNVAVLVVFAADYVVELALCGDRRRYVRTEWTSLVIVATQTLALAPSLAGFGILRAARGARALRAIAVTARLIAIGGSAARDGRTIIRRRAASFALGVAALT
jgi:hypothetical protein